MEVRIASGAEVGGIKKAIGSQVSTTETRYISQAASQNKNKHSTLNIRHETARARNIPGGASCLESLDLVSGGRILAVVAGSFIFHFSGGGGAVSF